MTLPEPKHALDLGAVGEVLPGVREREHRLSLQLLLILKVRLENFVDTFDRPRWFKLHGSMERGGRSASSLARRHIGREMSASTNLDNKLADLGLLISRDVGRDHTAAQESLR